MKDAGGTPPEKSTSGVMLFGEIVADVFPEGAVLGGAPFNVARHLAGFGMEAVLVSRVGEDTLGQQALELMRREGMDVSGVQVDAAHSSGQVQVVMEKDAHRFVILDDQAYDYIEAVASLRLADRMRPSLVYFGTLGQRCPVSRQTLTALLEATSSRRFLDINLRAPWFDRDTVECSLQLAHVLKLNDDELILLADMFGLVGSTAQEHAADLRRRYELETVIVTCGDRGAWLLDSSGVHAAPAEQPGQIVDTVGAGDGFAAVTILGLLSGWSVPLILNRASTFAAAVCGVRGAIPADNGLYMQFRQEWI